MPEHPPTRIAVVGSGVAGLVAAHCVTHATGSDGTGSARVTLYEADSRLGGHADTHRVTERSTGRELAIDTGFIVHNPRTYPVLLALFAELGVPTQPSEMSMSIRDDETGLEWAGALGRRGVLPSAGHLRRGRYLRMLTEIPRFHRAAKRLLADEAGRAPGETVDETLRDFLERHRFTAYFTRHFMEPMVAAVWSCDPAVALDYPARYLFTFLNHHGMLGIFGSPQWRTVTGGSHAYVGPLAEGLAEVRLGAKVTSVLETADGVEITDGNGDVQTYDGVVIATHPSQALSMLAEPTALQRELLSAMPYSPNTALLHTDTSVLPEETNTWASWNFRRPDQSSGGDRGEVMVTYDLTRLQRLDTDVHYLVTLGGDDVIDPSTVIDRMEYEHPLYNPTSVAAQARLPEIDTDRVVFAGAYHGWGFHEDGARSGLAAAERLGFTWPGAPSAADTGSTPAIQRRTPEGGAVYRTEIRHTRRKPFSRSFALKSHLWLVDVGDLPDHGVLGRFESRDHFGDPQRSIRDNVTAFLAQHDLEVGHGSIWLATQPRALGYCFNPISVFWCFDNQGEQVATVVEVHNTYGDRHAYLVHPDEQGRARTDKQMYVSPFHGTDGVYDLAVPLPDLRPDGRLDIAVTLTSDDDAVFSASLVGHRTDTSPLRAAPAALRGSLLIRAHGIWLWLRKLPIRPRPEHRQIGVQ